jgi:hypothetical protein
MTLDVQVGTLAIGADLADLEAPALTIGDQQAEMSLAGFRLTRVPPRLLHRGRPGLLGNEATVAPQGFHVQWSGPCPYCCGDGYRERVVPCGDSWRYEGECSEGGTRQAGYRSGSARLA